MSLWNILHISRITTRPADMNALDSDVIGFACRAVGNPRPKITWRVETFEGITIEDPKDDPSGRYETDLYKTLRLRYRNIIVYSKFVEDGIDF